MNVNHGRGKKPGERTSVRSSSSKIQPEDDGAWKWKLRSFRQGVTLGQIKEQLYAVGNKLKNKNDPFKLNI